MTHSRVRRSPAARSRCRTAPGSALGNVGLRAPTTATDVLVEVALPLPLFTTFSYRADGAFANTIVPGTRVVVPFRNRKEIGVCVGFAEPTDATRRYKSIIEVP